MKKNLVVLTGAGISAESGIATFRDQDGLWENHNIEDVATPQAWQKNPQLVLDFYNARHENVKHAKPNKAHLILKELENLYHVEIITQNVDDLHERAGSTNVLHLHGSLFQKCSDRNRSITAPWTEPISLGDKSPDGGQWRPDIVWFGEDVPAFTPATYIVERADFLIIVGTSLQVYPAASLKEYVRYGTPIYVIDPKLDYQGNQFTTVIKEPASVGMQRLKALL